MRDIESSAQLLTNLFVLSRESDDEARKLGGAYRCIEVTKLDRKISHSVVSAYHNLLGEVRIQLTNGVQRPSDTSDWNSIEPKPFVEDVSPSSTTIPFFMLAMRPQPIESIYPDIFVNPAIFVACAQDALSGRAQPVISSFWEALDLRSGQKYAGNLQKLGFSSRGIFLPQDRQVVESFVDFSQKIPKWGVTGTLQHIHSQLRGMRIEKISQYDLYTGTNSKVTYQSIPEEFIELADPSISDIAS
jgi:hypothetical protein